MVRGCKVRVRYIDAVVERWYGIKKRKAIEMLTFEKWNPISLTAESHIRSFCLSEVDILNLKSVQISKKSRELNTQVKRASFG